MKTAFRRLPRWLVAAAAVFVLYTVLGFFVAPPIARSQIEKRASAALGRQVAVEKVRVNPLVFSLTIEGLRIADHDGGELASWGSFYANFDPLASIVKREWHLGELRVVDPRARLFVDESGRINVADLLAAGEEAPAEPGSAIPPVGVGRLHIANGSVDFADRSLATPFHTVLGPMTFDLRAFTTRPAPGSPYSFAGATDTGERFVWSGTVSAQPFGSTGHVEFAEFSIPKHAPFFEHLHNAAIQGGRVGLTANYEVALGGGMKATVSNLALAVDDLRVGARGAAGPAVALRRLDVAVAQADLIARTAEVTGIALDGLEVNAERRADGSVDLLDLARPLSPAAGGEGEGAGGADAGPAPSVRIASVSLTNGRATVVDRTNTRPARLLADRIALTATGVGTDLDREVPVAWECRWNERGTLAVKGTLRPLPFAASFEVKADALDLAPLDPYLGAFADVRVPSGAVNVAGRVGARVEPDGRMAADWQGEIGLTGLAVTAGESNQPWLGWKSLALTGTRFSLDPFEVGIDVVTLSEPDARLIVAEDGSIGALEAWRPAGAAGTAPGTPAPKPAAATAERTSERVARATRQSLPFKAAIGAVVIDGGRVRLEDHSMKQGFATELRDIGGSIRGLSSESVARADVDLHASLDGVAPLKITGRINPLAEDVYSDLRLVFSNIDLPVFSPYSGRFIGQKIQKGKLRVEMSYQVSQRELAGENSIVFDQFYLGERVESPEAVKLPIGLALAVMRDREGRIPIDFAVRGNLDDPDFKYGRVVWRALGNIFLKAATSPFNLLGGMFGGRDQDISYVDFASGSADLDEAAVGKLEVLARALFERPALRLEITAPPLEAGDRPGLLETKFAELLRAEKQRLLAGAAAPAGAGGASAAPAPAASPSTGFAPEETDALVVSAFRRMFPEETARVAASEEIGALAAQPAAAGTGEEKREPNLFVRVWRSVFGGGEEPEPAPPVAAPPAAGREPAVVEAPPGAPPPIDLAEMRTRLLGTVQPTPADFQELADARARSVRDRILADGKVEAERVFLTGSSAVPDGANASADGGRVFFGLQ